jgi:uncharacterized protein (UPF0332 family)
MKERLDKESINLLVAYRMQRAKESLLEADVLIDSHFYNAAVNRLYYACYYAVIALLMKNEIAAHTHSGVKQMFGMHFVATEKIENKYSYFYSQLFNDRMNGDYDDFLQYELDMLQSLRPQAEEFINRIEQEMGSLPPDIIT